MPVELREEPMDGPGATPLVRAFEAEIATRYPGWTPGTGPSARPQDFAPPAGAFLVAYVDGRAAACGGLKRLDERSAEIKRVFVAPHARGSGLARALVARLEDRARRSGYAVLRLDTGDRQPEALALYRSAGYHDIEDYNGNPVARFWLEKRLG